MRILIADDSHLVRRGVVGLLSNEPPCQICGEASNAGETLTKANELRPDIVLLDVSMPGGNGLETARRLRQEIPGIKILMMSQHDPHRMASHCSKWAPTASWTRVDWPQICFQPSGPCLGHDFAQR
jgi:DNA-binding NarL/FixJ family response regulator